MGLVDMHRAFQTRRTPPDDARASGTAWVESER